MLDKGKKKCTSSTVVTKCVASSSSTEQNTAFYVCTCVHMPLCMYA